MHIVVLATALLGPPLIMVVVRANFHALRRVRRVRRALAAYGPDETPQLRLLDEHLGSATPNVRPTAYTASANRGRWRRARNPVLIDRNDASAWHHRGGQPHCMDEIAADLRRLARERRVGLCNESALWHAAVLRAYDDRLVIASEALGVPHRLADAVDEMDRELERMRLEQELQAAGLKFR